MNDGGSLTQSRCNDILDLQRSKERFLEAMGLVIGLPFQFRRHQFLGGVEGGPHQVRILMKKYESSPS